MAAIGAYADPADLHSVDAEIQAGQAASDQYDKQAAAQRATELDSLKATWMQRIGQHGEMLGLRNRFLQAIQSNTGADTESDLIQPAAGQDGGPAAPQDSGPADATPQAGGNDNASVVAATQAARQVGVPSSVLEAAKAQLGSQDYIGLCEKFVENIQGRSGVYPTALAAAKAQGLSKDWQNIQPGDEVFFDGAPENGGAGHVGVYDTAGKIVSATSHGVLDLPMTAFQAPVLGYVNNAAPTPQAAQTGESLAA